MSMCGNVQDSHNLIHVLHPISGILPAQNHLATLQTSPRNNTYPTWSKEFTFPGLDRAALQNGGLEVLLTDHRFFHNDVIGGIRLSIPQKKPTITSQINTDGKCIFTMSLNLLFSLGINLSPYRAVVPK